MNLILFGSFLIGLVLTLYGSVTLPSELPGYNGTYTDSSQNSSEQLQKHKNDLINYQIQSKEFIIIIVGVSILFFDILYILCYNYYSDMKEETKKRSRIKIIPYKQNINENVIKINKIKNQSINIVNSNKIPIVNPRHVKVTLPNITSKNINLPVIHKLQDYSKLYFHQLPPNYQKYFRENDKNFNKRIDYQYIK
jgi:hypothetical protein